MKKYLEARTRIAAIAMAATLGTFAFVAPQVANAQTAPEKIQLMAETLRARDSGNLDLAKSKAEELIVIAPNDENVQRLLASINNDLDRKNSGQAVYGQAARANVANIMAADGADSIVALAVADQDAKITAAEVAIKDSAKLAELGAYSDANALLDTASSSMTLNTSTAPVLQELEAAKANVVYAQAQAMVDAGNPRGAEELLETYRAEGGSSSDARMLSDEIDAKISDPYALSINEISPAYVTQSKIVRDLLTRGRAQYLNGDYEGASVTFREVEARDPNNPDAKLFQTRIAEELGIINEQNNLKTRQQMMTEVDQGWERPKVFEVGKTPVIGGKLVNETQKKMSEIIIPQVNFSGMELTRVIETLSELSVEYDPQHVGVNIIPLFDASAGNPRVNISLRNLNLDRILQFVTQQVNFAYDIGSDAVTVAPSDSSDSVSNTSTEFFPLSRATVIRLTGVRSGGSGGGSSASVDPFAAPSASSGGGGGGGDEVADLQRFFQSAGVNFEVPGASLAFDGEQLIVTQTRRNLERMRVILRNYNEVKQVEIESKFLEVNQNDLDELGFNWDVTSGQDSVFQFQPRSLSSAFSVDSGDAAINIDTPTSATSYPTPPPATPGRIDLATNLADAASSTVSKVFQMGAYDADFTMNAISRKAGSDLMSAPKVTVLSGKRASIVVAQELRYPESYGDIESTVSSGSGNSVGGSAISVTAGTPQDFVVRNVGVEMNVTPNVENDDTISLILEPRVTEFEGFVEYGGPSVALDGSGTVVTVPAGFYQPIFSTREITTEVTIFDGATVVMGGLTRDEVKRVNDKVPVLGDIPGIGRLFRSEGETRLKKNLLIFVTANLVSPGGSPARQNFTNLNSNSLFQNPTLMTPAGTVNRSITETAE